jgi:tmRNA-binding protein
MAGELSTAINIFEFKRAFKIFKTVEVVLAKGKQKIDKRVNFN